jgi:hypothetical protein
VCDHSQGAFDIVTTPSGVRAISQATRHPLVADWKGLSVAPGGDEGIELNQLIRQVRSLTQAQAQ